MDDEFPVDEFLEVLIEKLKKLLAHQFTTTKRTF